MANILIVDDEANIRRMLAGVLESDGHEVATAADGAEALRALERAEPDVVLLDLALPGPNGIVVLEDIRGRWPDVPVVMMSGRASLSDAVRATRIGAFHFLEKPLAPEALLLAIGGATELRRARALNRRLAAELASGHELVGSSVAMRRTRALIEQIAPTDARVLITGESGTGKELAATALHALSVRSSGPFVRVNCAAIPRELIESELFGHERGAFTGATEARRGRFELADGGTLLLDEIGDLGAEAQAKLLRSLETGRVQRIGSEREIAVDVRVIAATNHDLRTAIDAGTFRDDLFYRLDVLRITMPALREHAEDVPGLVAHFLGRLHAREGLEPPRVTDSAMRRLEAAPWPGNVRELANVCERLAILHAGREVRAHDLEGLVGEPAAVTPVLPASELPLSERVDAYERDVIALTLRDADGSVTEAARRLQTDRPNLYRRMRRLGIQR
ncbi:MAG: sigma-54 dependent transcriptional regulator [Gemmatimonadetes bacterium]|nr:sigma-54 dependent transcriptional regulator [Gemmatimonadota bacterium]